MTIAPRIRPTNESSEKLGREAADREGDVERVAINATQEQQRVQDEREQAQRHERDRERQEPEDRLIRPLTTPAIRARGRTSCREQVAREVDVRQQPRPTANATARCDRSDQRTLSSAPPLPLDGDRPGDDGRIARQRRSNSSSRASDGRPLVVDDAVVGRVPDAVAGHDHVVPEDALERRADPEERRPRRLVERVGLELDPAAPRTSNAWVSWSSFASRFAPVRCHWRRDPRPADLEPAVLGDDRHEAGAADRPAASPPRRVANGISVPASPRPRAPSPPRPGGPPRSSAGRSSSARSRGRGRPRRDRGTCSSDSGSSRTIRPSRVTGSTRSGATVGMRRMVRERTARGRSGPAR